MIRFDFTAPLLITLYAILFILATIVAAVLRWALRRPGTDAAEGRLDLDPYEIAYLSGGERLAIHGAVASLVCRGVLTVGPVRGRLSIGGEPLPPDAHLLERIIHELAAGAEPTPRELRRRAAPALALMAVQLQERGLLAAGRPARLARLLPLALVSAAAAPLLAGGALALALAAPVLAVLAAFARRPHRSRRGDRLLARFRAEVAPLRYTALHRPDALAGIDLALVVGLYGTRVLAEPLASAVAGRARLDERREAVR
jgi:uncharacterized protein (TIGR04222 family)